MLFRSAVVAQGIGPSSFTSFNFGFSNGTPSAAIRAVQAASPEALAGLATNATSTAGTAATVDTEDGDSTTLPKNGSGEATLTASGTTDVDALALKSGLPFGQNSAAGVVEMPGVVTYSNNNGTVTVAIAREDGSLQFLTVLLNASSPKSFDYPITLSQGSTMQLDSDSGDVDIIDSNANRQASIDAPWAVDAAGADTPTAFALKGSTLTQTVTTSSTSSYPIVADPSYSTCVKGSGIRTSTWGCIDWDAHETKDFASTTFTSSGIATVLSASCARIKKTVYATICIAAINVSVAYGFKIINDAATAHKCLRLKFNIIAGYSDHGNHTTSFKGRKCPGRSSSGGHF